MKNYLTYIILFSSFTAYAQDAKNCYYPLKEGNIWVYSIIMIKDCSQKVMVTEFNAEYNASLVKKVTKFGSCFPITTMELIEIRKDLVLLLGSKNALSGEWEFYSNQIKLKYPLSVGSAWVADSGDEIIEYKVVSCISLKVAAGEFENVYKIKSIIKYRERGTGKIKTFGSCFQYYAPNIGLIKEEIIEKDGSIEPFLELVSYTLR